MEAEKFAGSRHINEQYRWKEALISRLRDLLFGSEHFKLTQAQYLERRTSVYATEKRLTAENRAYVSGYMRALESMTFARLHHVRRIVGQPETASAAKWADMTEELRDACRERRTESCLAWDERAEHPYSKWSPE